MAGFVRRGAARALYAKSFYTMSLAAIVAFAADPARAEVFKLESIEVEANKVHPSQEHRDKVDRALNSSRSSSTVDGSIIQNLNPVNKMDSVRYNATGIINQPFSGDRFGGGTKIRTFGDFGAAQSIDGLPAFMAADQEGGGYSNTAIPSIAIDRITVQKGGRAVGYGDGTDGGVIETMLKSGRNYKDHQAISLDASSAREVIAQGEAADSGEKWDYYAAFSGMHGDYNGDPENLEQQRIYGGVTKLGWNAGAKTRVEFLGVFDRSSPDIYRAGALNHIDTSTNIASLYVDSQLTERTSIRVGHLLTDTRSQWPARSRDRSIMNNITFADGYYTAPLSDSVQFDATAGVEYKDTNSERDHQWDNTFHDYSVRYRNAFTFNDNLVLTAGGRVTWFNNDIALNNVEQPDNLETDTVLAYELGIAYSVLENTRLRLSTATGYNRFFSKYGNFGTDALNTTGAGDEVVESTTYEIGGLQTWMGGYFDAALYHITQENVPRRNSGAIESVTVDQNGLELEALAELSPSVTVSAGYMRVFTVEATRADGTKVNGNIFWDGQTASVPKDQISARIDYRPAADWTLWGMTHHNTGYESVDAGGNVTERRAFTRIDLGVAWLPTERLALRARLEDLLDEKDFGSTVEGVPVNDSGKLGRVFWLGLDYTF